MEEWPSKCCLKCQKQKKLLTTSRKIRNVIWSKKGLNDKNIIQFCIDFSLKTNVSVWSKIFLQSKITVPFYSFLPDLTCFWFNLLCFAYFYSVSEVVVFATEVQNIRYASEEVKFCIDTIVPGGQRHTEMTHRSQRQGQKDRDAAAGPGQQDKLAVTAAATTGSSNNAGQDPRQAHQAQRQRQIGYVGGDWRKFWHLSSGVKGRGIFLKLVGASAGADLNLHFLNL